MEVHNTIAAGNAMTFERSTARDMLVTDCERRLYRGDARRLAARDINIKGKIVGGVRAVARRVTISGNIDGKADLIVIAPGADR